MIDTIRHIEVFSPEQFGDERVDVIGAGATGSRIALSLAKLGISQIRVWDFDRVEPHNVPNQVFGIGDVGQLKVEALQRIIKEQTGTEITIHPERVDGTQELGPIVFLLTDTMTSRAEIWKAGLRYKPRVKLMIETRMGANSGRVYTVNPMNRMQITGWEETLYGDDVAEVSACGTSITVGPTAEFVSGLAVWQLIRWQQISEQNKQGMVQKDELENEIMFSLQPMQVFSSSFQ